jgi:Putative auto-transporter adhesin, head GIN domain
MLSGHPVGTMQAVEQGASMRLVLLILMLALAGSSVAQPVPVMLAGTVVVGSSGNRIDGSGRVTDEIRSLAPFSAIRINGPIEVQLKASAREQVTIHFDDNLTELIETLVVGDATPTLAIAVRPGAGFKSRHAPKVIVEFKAISELSQHGSGDVNADVLSGPLLAVSMSGNGDVRVGRVDVDVLGVAISGSGNFTAKGRAAEQGYSIAGSGDVRAADLVGQSIKVRIAGSGDARVHAESLLTVSIAGSGDVIYRGTPVIKKSIAGSGEVRKAH